jgi:adenylate kinase
MPWLPAYWSSWPPHRAVSGEPGGGGRSSERILLLGRQGAGKGLIGRLLAGEIDGCFVSMGDLLRAEQRRGTDLGREIGRLIHAGYGVPPDVSYPLMARALKTRRAAAPLVLDGVPRRANEIGRVQALLGAEPTAVVLLDVPVPMAVERLLGRQTCRGCGMPHGAGWPPLDGQCRDCGDAVYARPDDAEFTKIRRRLEVWGSEARSIVAYYGELGLLSQVQAEVRVSEVLARVVAALMRDAP